jgi:hypothetical protein
VQVRLEHMRDAQPPGAGGLEVDIDIASGIDDRRDPGGLIDDECRQMPEPLDPVLGDTHGRSLYREGPC